MRFSNHKLADSGRFLRRSFLFACLASLLLGSSSKASTTVLQFSQVNAADVVTLTNDGLGNANSSTLSTAGNPIADGGPLSIAVTITNFLGTPGLNILAYETFVNVISSGAATFNSMTGVDSQPFTGKIEFTSAPGGAGANYLTLTFGKMVFDSTVSGQEGGTQATLVSTQPPNSLVLTSDFETFGPPTALSIGFSGLSPGLTIFNNSLGALGATTMQSAGTISATVIVPEPSTFAIAGLGALGMIGYGLRRRKALGA